MVDLYPEKLVTIITTSMLEGRLVRLFRERGTSGYTIVPARGAGSRGEQTGLDFDANILVEVILPADRLDPLLDDIKRLIARGHHLTLYVSDVSVISPEKFTRPFEG
ncbi:P-II family nitrogen regulator [Roseospira navarrensis]|uniref:Nitrogen regulatory protein P-II n=1 Tax=Roseospira navarrensis TaxID=140058 RepID=A0A7X1ZHL0_9PROT|nr:transcriptional regulator [Roseospira navarrensis]MQX37365.1 transcriptional regulator [Roseospira navarrensis]